MMVISKGNTDAVESGRGANKDQSNYSVMSQPQHPLLKPSVPFHFKRHGVMECREEYAGARQSGLLPDMEIRDPSITHGIFVDPVDQEEGTTNFHSACVIVPSPEDPECELRPYDATKNCGYAAVTPICNPTTGRDPHKNSSSIAPYSPVPQDVKDPLIIPNSEDPKCKLRPHNRTGDFVRAVTPPSIPTPQTSSCLQAYSPSQCSSMVEYTQSTKIPCNNCQELQARVSIELAAAPGEFKRLSEVEWARMPSSVQPSSKKLEFEMQDIVDEMLGDILQQVNDEKAANPWEIPATHYESDLVAWAEHYQSFD